MSAMCEATTTCGPETYHFRLDAASLGLTADEVARGMGYAGGAASTHFAEDLDRLLLEAPARAQIEGGFRVFSPEDILLETEGFRACGNEFHTGRVIARPLQGAATLAFFVVTAGKGMTDWSQELMGGGDHLQAYFVDALGSELVEKAADRVEEQIVAWALNRGRGTTNRYSPGYCGWSVSEQHKLFSLLPPDFCGITLTESALMQPEKSVSGVIGIGGAVRKEAYGCKICSMEDCFRRVIDRAPGEQETLA
ncbi:MAG: methionine synthase [Candidatus Hydrogenedentes bacterium]|nr:methionine synthase [Candidatus Hydrogenedentota bacterium]